MAKSSLDILYSGIEPTRQKKLKVAPLFEVYNDFSDKQLDLLNAPLKRINIAEGAVRSGKTFITVFAWCKFVKNSPSDATFIMIGRTLTTLKRNVLDLLTKVAGSDNFKYSLSKKEGVLYGRTIYLEGADNALAEDKIRGMTVTGAYCDELTLVPRSFFIMLLSRLSKPNAALIGTTNPDRPSHWIHKEYLQNSQLDLARWRFTMDDNPDLPQKYRDNLKKEYTGLQYDRMILGKWVAADGAIYKGFKPDLHVKNRQWFNEFTRQHPILLSTAGGDFGGNKSATTLYNAVFTKNFEYVIITEEYYNQINEDSETIISHYVSRGKRWKSQYKMREMFLDNAETLMLRTVKRKCPVIVQGSRKMKIRERIRLVETLISQGRFFVLNECPKLIEALETAVWDSNQDSDVRLDDGSTNIDSLDGMEYCLEKYTRRLLRI